MNPILVTGANGHLGRCVLEELSRFSPDGDVFGLAETAAEATELESCGLRARLWDRSAPESLCAALSGIRRMILAPTEPFDTRVASNRTLIDAARAGGIRYIAYPSFLHADRSPLRVAHCHRATEAALAASGIEHTVLRNGWYSEMLLHSLDRDLARGRHAGTSGKARLSVAPLRDYAAAAAVAILNGEFAGRVYELAGDKAISRAEYAAILSKVSGREVTYRHLTRREYTERLVRNGMPKPKAEMVADGEVNARKGWLESDSRQLSRLIGRPTMPISETLRAALSE